MRGLSVSCPEKLWVSQSLPVSAWHTVLSWNRKCAQMHFLSGYGAWECDTEDNHLQHSHPGNSTCASSVRGSKISVPTGALQKRMELTSGAMIILVHFIFGAWLFYQLLVLWMCSVLLFILLFCFLISVCVVLCCRVLADPRRGPETPPAFWPWAGARGEENGGGSGGQSSGESSALLLKLHNI